MKVGILGLGLIGGSLARAYAKAGHTVYVCDTDEQMVSFAELAGVGQRTGETAERGHPPFDQSQLIGGAYKRLLRNALHWTGPYFITHKSALFALLSW